MDFISNRAMRKQVSFHLTLNFSGMDPLHVKALLGGPSHCSWSFGLMGHVSQHQLLAKAGGVNHSTYSGMSQSAFSWAQVMHDGINQPKMEKPNISHHGGKYTLQVGCQAATSISLPISKDTSIPDAR